MDMPRTVVRRKRQDPRWDRQEPNPALRDMYMQRASTTRTFGWKRADSQAPGTLSDVPARQRRRADR
jgi:hypothetical protein